jgi:hypothetical protein
MEIDMHIRDIMNITLYVALRHDPLEEKYELCEIDGKIAVILSDNLSRELGCKNENHN